MSEPQKDEIDDIQIVDFNASKPKKKKKKDGGAKKATKLGKYIIKHINLNIQ